METFSNEKIVSLLDLTSLNAEDTDTSITALCKKSVNQLGMVAAICIHKEFIPLAKQNLHKDINIATVINFPGGDYDIKDTLSELEIAINNGAHEIDLVMPYKQLILGERYFVEQFIRGIKINCTFMPLKVIIESGELATEELIRLASKIAINEGANFIKTSTGKVKINATLPAAQYMLEEIKLSGATCGFKASGGIKTLKDAIDYLNLAYTIMGSSFINKATFRFGASSLLDDLLQNKTSSDNY